MYSRIRFFVSRVVDRIIAYTPAFKWDVSKRFFESIVNLGNDRDAQDDQIQKLLLEVSNRKNTLPSVSAVYRVKNAAPFLELSLKSVAPFVTEIIVVDNGSVDETCAIVGKLKKEFASSGIDLVLFRYEQEIARAGSGYLAAVKRNPEKSIAKYYSYCFGKATSEYVMKVDAHCIYHGAGLLKLQDAIEHGIDVTYFRGIEFFQKRLSVEPYLFRKSVHWHYEDQDSYELLVFKQKKLKKFFVKRPVFIHMKRIVYGASLANQVHPLDDLYRSKNDVET